MLKSTRSIAASLFLALVFSISALPTLALSAEQPTSKWQAVMEFYENTRLERLIPLLLQNVDITESSEIIAIDYNVFLDTFKYMSKIGGPEYDSVAEREASLFAENPTNLINPKALFLKRIEFKEEYEKIFGRAKNDEERRTQDMLISGDVGFRFFDIVFKDDPERAFRAKFLLIESIWTPIKKEQLKKFKVT